MACPAVFASAPSTSICTVVSRPASRSRPKSGGQDDRDLRPPVQERFLDLLVRATANPMSAKYSECWNIAR